MSDSVRDRIAKAIHQCDARPVSDGPSVHDFHVADAVIAALNLTETGGVIVGCIHE